jgi:predicted MFS family arabinose efflux permease
MTIASPERSRATYRQVLAEPRFRLLFATRFLGIAADTLRILALSVLVFAVTGSALLSAVTYGIGFLPQAVGAALLGTLADRIRPRRLIAAGYALEAVTAALLGLAHLPVGASLGIVAGVACLTPVFGGASTRVAAEVLTGDAYVLGRSLSNMSSSAAQLLGLACGGLAVATVGTRHALLVSAGCHLAAALAVRLRLPDLAPPPGTRKGSTLRSSLSNSGRLLADARVRGLMLAQWLPPAFFVGGESLIVAYAAARRFPSGAAGILIACVPVGMLAGDFVVGRFVAPATRERLVVPLVVILGMPLIAFAADPPLILVGALLILAGTGFAYALGLQRRFLDALPPTVRGQAFGLLSAGLMTMQGAGPVAFGFLAAFTSTGVSIALAGVATVVVALACRDRPDSAGLVSAGRTRCPPGLAGRT